MCVQIVISPYKDPSSGLDWKKQTNIIKKTLDKKISSYKKNIEFNLKESEHGIGADYPTIIIEIIGLGSIIFFSIPKLHKKIRDSIDEWKIIWHELSKFIMWLKKKEKIISYSKEIAFLKSLALLDKKTNILDLELVSYLEIPGKSSHINPVFSNTTYINYLFVFKNDNYMFLLIYDSKLKLRLKKILKIDQFNNLHSSE